MATRGLPTWPWARTCPDELPAPERLLLETMRAWHAARRADAPTLAALRLPLIAEGAGAAAGPLDRMLGLAAEARPEGIGIAACPLCPHVTPAEAMILLGCAIAQRGAAAEALAVLALWVPGTAPILLPQAAALGAALRHAGLLLALPPRAPRPWHRATASEPVRRHGGAQPSPG